MISTTYNTRASKDEYFMTLAYTAATQATCPRLHVGCVIVNAEHHVLSTGYNGSVRKLKHCNEVGCLMVEGHCARTAHAEANAVNQAAYNGVKLARSTAYVTHSPCLTCFKSLLQAGVDTVVYDAVYPGKVLNDVLVQFVLDLAEARGQDVSGVLRRFSLAGASP